MKETRKKLEKEETKGSEDKEWSTYFFIWFSNLGKKIESKKIPE
jgi:hypothetical protein